MRTDGIFSSLLTSLCVRFAAAMPPVWLRGSTWNRCGVNHLGFDYPLDCSWFLYRYLSGLGLRDLGPATGVVFLFRGQRWDLEAVFVGSGSVMLVSALLGEVDRRSCLWCAGLLLVQVTGSLLHGSVVCSHRANVVLSTTRLRT
jgi:hypothetical protein